MLSKKQKRDIKLKLRRTRKRLNLWFIPGKKNNYRPLFVRRYSLMTVLALVVCMQISYNFTKTGSILGQVTEITPAGLLLNTNDIRISHGLNPLKTDDRLSMAAASKAEDMLERDYWSHDSPDGTQPWEWIDRTGYNYTAAGENLAKDFTSSGATTSAWMDSESHRDNILKDSFEEVGFAVAKGELAGEETTLVVALYSTPEPKITPTVGTNRQPEATISTSVAPVGFASLSPATRVGIAIQSLTPAAATSIALLFIAATVAISAHIHRRKLPKRLQKSWYKQHGAIKASVMIATIGIIILLYGGGQL